MNNKYTTQELADILGLNISFRRLGYHLENNPNRLMKDGIKSITVHQTDSFSVGADAENHHNYLRKGTGGRKVSWHYAVDEKVVIQHFRDDRVTWHSGHKVGNESSIGIEMCVDADKKGDKVMGKSNYLKTVDNGAKLVAIKLFEHGLTLNDVKQHYDWTKKNCPSQIRGKLYGYTWSDFMKAVDTHLSSIDLFINPPPKNERKTAGKGKLFRVSVASMKYRDNAEELKQKLLDAGFKDAFLVVVDDPNYKGD